MSKNILILLGATLLGFLVGFFPIYLNQAQKINHLKTNELTLIQKGDDLSNEIENLQPYKKKADQFEAELSRMSLKSAYGGGVNLKLMPNPETLEPTVGLNEIFSFDSYHAFCRVETNHEPFIMPTFSMGDILIGKNEFYMVMATTSMDEFRISETSDGKRKLIITGGLDCATEVAKANTKIGSKDASEHATYKIEALDGGLGGGQSGDSFEFTAYFSPVDAPVNYAIFGPQFTFTGEMISGEITIADR